jgi:MinD-like ATPase involved in chromosome partitioning or flagellar assembly
MSTPPDFFTSDNDPRPDKQPAEERRPATAASQDGERRYATPTSTDTGPQHRSPAAPPPDRGAPAPQAGSAPSSGESRRPPQAGPPPSAAPGQRAAAPPRHQQQPYRPTQGEPAASQSAQPDPQSRWQSRRAEDPDASEQTTVLSQADFAAAREQAAHDPGVGDFFGAPSGPNPVVPQGWSPTTGPASGPQPLFEGALGGGGEPFVGGSYGGGQDPDEIVTAQRRTQTSGWRKAVSVMTFGLIRPGPSAKQQRDEELIRRIRASLLDVYVVAFVNSKGGVGKTTMAVAAGNAIARERGDRVIVVDVDTDLGNLSARFHENGGPKANIEALAALPNAGSYSNVRVFTVQNDDRLEMLSSQNDPRSSYRLNSHDFESAMRILRSHYNVILLDCGTSITSNLFPTIAKQVNCLVVVSSNDAPGLNGAWRTLSWLQAHGFAHLMPRTVVALNANSGDKPAVDMKDVEAKFREQVEEVVGVPYDKHLHEGGFISFPMMAKHTRKAVMELAGSIAMYYPSRQPRQRHEELGSY